MIEAIRQGLESGQSPIKVSDGTGGVYLDVKNGYSCEEMGSSKIPVNEVHMISILDIRLANADRHVGNILYLENIDFPDRLVPIDHGFCLPESFEGITLEWRFWRQAYMPYSLEMLKYIESLDAEKDIEMLKLHKLKISPESCLVLRISTMLLKKSAAAGLTANNIAYIMCKVKVDVEASDIEIILEEAEVVFLEAVSVKIDSYIANMKK
ncbi:hypothetical protein SUGI_0869140 [Cryptomeria japonica]|nr:hypothetical protein SUGI_0869140 [Cryptomeria japonica]